MDMQRTQNSQVNFDKRNNNNKIGGITLPDVKTTAKVTVIKTVCWHKQESVIQSEVSQKEKNKLSYIDAYMWNLEKWYR